MFPKEKAIDLYEKFYYLTPSILADKKQDMTAKGCAMKCVDEILLAIDEDILPLKNALSRKYWELVKSEIANL